MLLSGESLYKLPKKKQEYYDKRSKLSEKEYFSKQKKSKTLYVGNLTAYTKEETLFRIFSMVGPIDRLILGLNKKFMIPCGFCFVIYFTREDAQRAINLLNKTLLDGNVIRVDFDIGFSEGRQYGRGYQGGQVRDEVKRKSDYKRESHYKQESKDSHWKRSHHSRFSKDYRKRDDRYHRNNRRSRDYRKYKRVK
jgi:nuclear cap-binding protein subunit 2